MTLFRSLTIFLMLVMAPIVVACHGGFLEPSAAPAIADTESFAAQLHDDCRLTARTSDIQIFHQSAGQPPKMARIPTAQLLRDYYSETLSVVPALMFSPVALQLAFAHTVNLPIDEHDNTLLHIASRSGDVFAAWQLLEFGANPGIANTFQKLPVDVVFQGNAQVAASLTAAFSSHRDAIADVLCRRPARAPSTETQTSSPGRKTAITTPAGITIGLIAR